MGVRAPRRSRGVHEVDGSRPDRDIQTPHDSGRALDSLKLEKLSGVAVAESSTPRLRGNSVAPRAVASKTPPQPPDVLSCLSSNSDWP